MPRSRPPETAGRPISDLTAAVGSGVGPGQAGDQCWRMGVLHEVYEATADAVPAARHAVTAYARRTGVADGRLTDIALAVSEACSNVVVHAYPHRAEPGRMEVTARRPDDVLEVAVSDAGRGMMPRTDSPGLGLGLPLVTRVAEQVEIQSPAGGGTHVKMFFTLNHRRAG
jgi:serine/threonine-protein kinase RsbW